jgi:RNA polymerase sigma-70 factor (ECF subfamily)
VSLALTRDLAGEALQGQSDAWQALIQKYNQHVVLSLLAAGAPPARARELAHDAWSRLVEQQRLGRLPRLELPGLAIRQARFLWLDETRRRTSDGDAQLDDLPDPAPTAEERYLTRDQLARARATLTSLPESAQRVFRLVYENPGIAHAEAAAQLGLSTQRVRQILCEVRKQLRATLEE